VVFVLAFIFAIWNLLSFAAAISVGDMISAVSLAIHMLACIAIVLASFTKYPQLYLVPLVVNGISIGYNVLLSLFLAVTLFINTETQKDIVKRLPGSTFARSYNKNSDGILVEKETSARLILAACFFGTLVVLAILACWQIAVYRCYEQIKLKNDAKNRCLVPEQMEKLNEYGQQQKPTSSI